MNIQPDSFSSSELQQRISKILDVELQEKEKSDALRQVLGVIDLTTLEGSDTDERIQNLCSRARNFYTYGHGIPNIAAVCVYPVFVKLAKAELRNSGVAVASVAGAFPSGQSPISLTRTAMDFLKRFLCIRIRQEPIAG